MSRFFRHPLIGRASSTFILYGCADIASQLFLSSPASIDPDRAIRFSSAGALSVIPVWFGWNRFLSAPVVDAKGLLRRIVLEACFLGPLYLSSILWWSGTFRNGDLMDGFTVVNQSAFSLYLDALKVVPAYNAITYFAIAPHMRGYALGFFQFFWNIYVSWFVDNACTQIPPKRSSPTTGSLFEILKRPPQLVEADLQLSSARTSDKENTSS
jgi:hypothetical protein